MLPWPVPNRPGFVVFHSAYPSAGSKQRKPEDHEVYLVATASHNLKPVKGLLDTGGLAGDIAPEAAEKLRNWIGKTLHSKPKN